MIVTYGVQIGVDKKKCDDAVLIDSRVISNSYGTEKIIGSTKIMIADGVGGNAGGEEASSYVLNAVREINIDKVDLIKKQLVMINENLIQYGSTIDGNENMATTVTGLLFNDRNNVLVHCGNTRIYAIQGNFLKQITVDQTTYQWLISVGNLEAAENCNKSEIRGAFGGGTTKYVETLVVENIFERGLPTKILMTSDGIHDVLNIDEIEENIANENYSSMEKIKRLIESAVSKGSKDDCTAMLVEID